MIGNVVHTSLDLVGQLQLFASRCYADMVERPLLKDDVADAERLRRDRVKWQSQFLTGGRLIDLHLLYSRDPKLFDLLATSELPNSAPEWVSRLAALARLIWNCAEHGYEIQEFELMFNVRPGSGSPYLVAGDGVAPYRNFILRLQQDRPKSTRRRASR